MAVFGFDEPDVSCVVYIFIVLLITYYSFFKPYTILALREKVAWEGQTKMNRRRKKEFDSVGKKRVKDIGIGVSQNT